MQDLDFESLKPLDALLQNITVAVAKMTDDAKSALYIPNAFMASVPSHSLWWFVLRRAIVNLEKNPDDIFSTTGPVVLRDAITEYETVTRDNSEASQLSILPSHVIYGVNFEWGGDPAKNELFRLCHLPDAEFNASRCKELLPEGYTLTYWSGECSCSVCSCSGWRCWTDSWAECCKLTGCQVLLVIYAQMHVYFYLEHVVLTIPAIYAYKAICIPNSDGNKGKCKLMHVSRHSTQRQVLVVN